jgi:hypothetical protein
MRKVTLLSLMLIVMLGLAVVPASADTLYNFTFGTGGTVTALGGGQFTGSSIVANKLEVFNTVTLSDVFYTITGGSLNFNTSTKAFTITGNAGAFGSGTLLNGTLLAFTVATGTCGAGNTSCNLSFTSGTSNLGAFTGFVMSNNPSGSSWTATSDSVSATTPVPEPASLALLGSGLAAVSLLRRKLIKK